MHEVWRTQSQDSLKWNSLLERFLSFLASYFLNSPPMTSTFSVVTNGNQIVTSENSNVTKETQIVTNENCARKQTIVFSRF